MRTPFYRSLTGEAILQIAFKSVPRDCRNPFLHIYGVAHGVYGKVVCYSRRGKGTDPLPDSTLPSPPGTTAAGRRDQLVNC